ncbi:hypothetical protein SMF913_25955 [Streptomyces malaysiensis]|uniref:Uncharacterized protein n=1 Tax=Streptomyces malaysiensis TaxID=92644 RepID=A0A2J7YR55_STRMQ|nr:hypothetical protein SMF913_25955 [Streptomyces malaysiensis]
MSAFREVMAGVATHHTERAGRGPPVRPGVGRAGDLGAITGRMVRPRPVRNGGSR